MSIQIKNSKNAKIKSFNTASTTSTSSIPSSLISDLTKLNLTEERLKRYIDEAITLTSGDELKSKALSLREKAISKTISNVNNSVEVDLCFVLDCTGSMAPHIAAAKDCILQVSNYVENTNPNIKLRVGFCGYRDYVNNNHDIQVFDFTDKYEQFTQYLSNVKARDGDDCPEDVLGGLNAAITQMNWLYGTRALLHIGDCPPHGRRFSYLPDNYPDGDPNGLTAENVLEKMKSKNILYFFGKVTDHTDRMIEVFRNIIGGYPIFDLVGEDPIQLFEKFVTATSASITIAVSLTSTVGSNSRDMYSILQKKINMNPNKPDWNTLSLKNGVIMWYCIPKSVDELKNTSYFNKSNLFSKSFSFKVASQPFSAGVERCAYFALDIKNKPEKEMVIKEYFHVGRNDPFEKYLEAVEISTIAYFLSIKFNSVAERKNIPKVNFINSKLLRYSCYSFTNPRARYYTIETKLRNTEYKRFNTNTGVITELRPVLEAFVHFTYACTKGYLVVCDLQGNERNNDFLLTDPAIHCTDPLRFGRTNFGKRGIERFFLANHKCNDVCKKLKLSTINNK